MRDLVIIEDSTLMGILADPRYTQLLPCLGQAATKLAKTRQGGCGRCSRRQRDDRVATLTNARNCLISAGPAEKTGLKRLLNAKKIRLIAYNSQQKRVVYTF